MKLILILFFTAIYSVTYTATAQTKGKIVRNQSVKATSVRIDTLSFHFWFVEIMNMNNCVSEIQFIVDDAEDTVVKQIEPMASVNVLLKDSFSIKFRNGTSCAGGNMDWLTIDTNKVTLGNQYSMKNEDTFNPPIGCYSINLRQRIQ